jgi:glycosyltransferase involved in cell wall biosynthesis
MKICLVNLDFGPTRSSGLAVYGETLATGLAREGHQVTVVSSKRDGLPGRDEIDGVQVYRTALGRGDWISFAWRAGPLVGELNRKGHFDVVHFLDAHFAYHYRSPFVASLFQSFRQRATSEGGLPYHSHWRDLIAKYVYYHSARWLAERPAVGRADHLLAASQAAADEFGAHYGVAPQRMTVVPLGIDLGRFQPQDASGLRRELGLEGMRVLLFVGFGTPRKGLHYLAPAMARLPADVRLLVVGRWEPAYRKRFYRLLGPARDRVIEVGTIPDNMLPRYYAVADLFVFPTLLEGFGLPLAESLACSTPVVTTWAGASPEVAGPGGRVVPPRDLAALAEAIEQLLDDDSLRRRLADAGREWVLARFDARRMVSDTLAVYQQFSA